MASNVASSFGGVSIDALELFPRPGTGRVLLVPFFLALFLLPSIMIGIFFVVRFRQKPGRITAAAYTTSLMASLVFIAVAVLLYPLSDTSSSTLPGKRYVSFFSAGGEGIAPISTGSSGPAPLALLPVVFLFKQHSNRDSAQATFHTAFVLSVVQALAPVFCLAPVLLWFTWAPVSSPHEHVSNRSSYCRPQGPRQRFFVMLCSLGYILVVYLGLWFFLWVPLYRQFAVDLEAVDVFDPGHSRAPPRCPEVSNITKHYQDNFLWPAMIVDEWTGEAGRYMDSSGESLFGTNDTVEAAAMAAGLRCSVALKIEQTVGLDVSRMIFPAEEVLRCECSAESGGPSTATCPTVEEIFEQLHQASRPRYIWRRPQVRVNSQTFRTCTECKFEEDRFPEWNVVWHYTVIVMAVYSGLLLLHILAVVRSIFSAASHGKSGCFCSCVTGLLLPLLVPFLTWIVVFIFFACQTDQDHFLGSMGSRGRLAQIGNLCLATVHSAYTETLSCYLLLFLLFSVFSGSCITMSSLWVRRGSPGEVPGPPPPVAEVLAEGPILQQHAPQRGSASSSDVSDKSFVSARDVDVE